MHRPCAGHNSGMLRQAGHCSCSQGAPTLSSSPLPLAGEVLSLPCPLHSPFPFLLPLPTTPLFPTSLPHHTPALLSPSVPISSSAVCLSISCSLLQSLSHPLDNHNHNCHLLSTYYVPALL